MGPYEARADDRFWLTLQVLRAKYSHAQIVEIINIVKEAIAEPAERGRVEEAGRNDHVPVRHPCADGGHPERHIYDDDVLVVCFRRARNRRIRMAGIHDRDPPAGWHVIGEAAYQLKIVVSRLAMASSSRRLPA